MRGIRSCVTEIPVTRVVPLAKIFHDAMKDHLSLFARIYRVVFKFQQEKIWGWPADGALTVAKAPSAG